MGPEVGTGSTPGLGTGTGRRSAQSRGARMETGVAMRLGVTQGRALGGHPDASHAGGPSMGKSRRWPGRVRSLCTPAGRNARSDQIAGAVIGVAVDRAQCGARDHHKAAWPYAPAAQPRLRGTHSNESCGIYSRTPVTGLANGNGDRARRRDASNEEHRSRPPGSAGAFSRPARRPGAGHPGRLPGAAQLLDRLGTRG
jgi:hypothetical protein